MKEELKIAFIGLGSIGKRHLLNVNRVLSKRNRTFTIDLIRRKNSADLTSQFIKLVNNVYAVEEEEVPNDYDVIFITNPTNLHYDTIREYSDKTKHMFIEKPVFSDINCDYCRLNLRENGVYYVACPLRYTKVIQYVKNSIDLSKVYSVRAISSSFLPEWRPGVDYRNTYSAHAEHGGGVSIDLIHEWDYLIYLFGKPNELYNIRGKYSRLELTSDDLSIYISKFKKMMAEVHLDYFGRETIRELQLFTSEDTIIADIANSEVRYLKRNQIIRFNEDRDEYQRREIEYFFDVIEGNALNINNIETALLTLKIAKTGSI